MTKVAIIRCEKNEARCPLTSCLKSLSGTVQGFAGYDECELVGVFTCRCPGEVAGDLGRILKAKGAEAIHFTTCAFAGKVDGAWTLGNGFCPNLDEVAARVAREAGIPCIKGSAHLPQGYRP